MSDEIENKKDTDVFNILNELISKQQKKQISAVSKQDHTFSTESSINYKNDDLKQSTSYSPNFIVKPDVDPASIETYPSALRYIIQLTMWDPSILKKIKEMVEEQASYEEKWLKDREILIENLRNKQKANEIVSSLTGEEEKEFEKTIEDELLLYDLKIHRALREMSKAQEKELQKLGIPFFVNTKNKISIENKKKVIQLLKDLISK
ncbi:hypothetical protein T552_00759 [Pneumocystis carinii B80]|uniref:Uncharacterized protein n=1 Tax=Pneumocystis carinii (strain B80) TaxID=1408658 RepID=A0A0W4ZPJ8_PNEC8|nr:hypothetical protein T552_00759 [Pneumocystis carinii B80]KTW30285.1 hypothetical protein T552_00759 [Pneumocystis carinii B80]